uniref:Vacuolar fusion protein MON1 homolog n=1 Tax=Panagrolaimus superbus TaxID=310955 RepID=A0A914YZG5_9BILA
MSAVDEDNEEDQRELLAALPYQIWILSEYGKPIFSSCGREDEMSSFFALIQVLVKRYETWENGLKSIQTSGLHIEISFRAPLILCIVSRHPFNLVLQLDIVFNQILSMLSRKSLKDVYEKKGDHFDLRRWLDGVDKRVNACVKGFNEDPVVFSSGFRILPLNCSDREFIVNLMATSINEANLNNVAFAILVAHRQLIAIVRMKKCNLTASDFNIVVNLIETHNSLRDGERFVPICLPNFNQNGYLHAYISYLWEGAGPCLLLLSTSPQAFYDLSKIRIDIEDKMLQYKRYAQLKNSLTQPDPFFIKQMACNELWHFMYKNVQLSQICCSSPEKPYITVEELEYIFRGYFKFSDMARRVNNRVKMFFYQLETFSLFSWITESFELHCIFSPFVTKKTAWMTAENMLKILRKYEKKVFFTLQPGLLNG